jgi:hypothetical protein
MQFGALNTGNTGTLKPELAYNFLFVFSHLFTFLLFVSSILFLFSHHRPECSMSPIQWIARNFPRVKAAGA